jgi:hypothetical protein
MQSSKRTTQTRPVRPMALVVGCVALPLWVACNQIAGIQEGTPGDRDGGADASGADGTIPDSGANDAKPGADAPADARLDATLDTNPPSDVTMPEAAPGPVACTVEAFSLVAVDDLSARNAGFTTFAPVIGIFPLTDDPTTVTVVAQLDGDFQELLGYTVTFGQTTNLPTSLTGGFTDGGITLFGTVVDPGGFGNAALTTYFTGRIATGFEEGLQVVQLPNTTQDLLFGLGYPLANLGEFSVNSATFAQTSAKSAVWVAAGRDHPVLRGDIYVGAGSSDDGGSPGVAVDRSTQNFYQLANPQIFEMGSTIYAMTPGVVPNGTTVIEVPSDLSDAGTQELITGPDAATLVIAAHRSVADPSRAIVLAESQTSQGAFATYGASVAPGSLGTLVVGQPPFVQNPPLSPTELPSTSTSAVWSGDELFLFGVPADVTGPLPGAALLWLGPDGHVVSSSSTSGGQPIVVAKNPIVATAVAAQDTFGEARAHVVVAWVEQVTTDAGTQYGRLWTERVVCQPAPSGGD